VSRSEASGLGQRIAESCSYEIPHLKGRRVERLTNYAVRMSDYPDRPRQT